MRYIKLGNTTLDAPAIVALGMHRVLRSGSEPVSKGRLLHCGERAHRMGRIYGMNFLSPQATVAG
jgi:hypothetical protein